MKFLMGLCIALLTACSSCAGLQVREKYYRDVDYIGHESSVRISAVCLDGRYVGSGVAISPDTVLTALHVTTCDEGPALSVTVIDLRGNEYEVVNEVSADGDVDITKLVVKGTPFKVWAPVEIEQVEMPKIGAPICWYGGDGFIETRGFKKCGFYEGYQEIGRTPWHYISGKSAPGNSGSGIFNINGQLIGILNVGRWDSSYDFVTGFTSIDKAP